LGDHRWILFSDLDGTVLDKETYEPGPSLQALSKCGEAGIHVIFSSSKTGAEVDLYHARYVPHPGSPFVTENGGGVFFPRDHWEKPPGGEGQGRFWKVILGASHEEVLEVLTEGASRVGAPIRTFSGMTPEEVARRTGLSLEEAKLARQRDFDEPFWIEDHGQGTLGALQEAIEAEGMQLTRGGRCFHVHGVSDKGKAARYVRERFEQVFGALSAAAVGDAANDLPMFRAVDRAYLVKAGDAGYDPGIPREGNIRFVPGVGPSGFLQAVDDLLHRLETERSSSR
jgi:mannosyl-3-phosphoglycerate phosphatase